MILKLFYGVELLFFKTCLFLPAVISWFFQLYISAMTSNGKDNRNKDSQSSSSVAVSDSNTDGAVSINLRIFCSF